MQTDPSHILKNGSSTEYRISHVSHNRSHQRSYTYLVHIPFITIDVKRKLSDTKGCFGPLIENSNTMINKLQ